MTLRVSDRGSVQARPVIALDGTESMEGRALFLISTLYWCLDWLSAVDLRLIDVTAEDVTTAARVFQWEHGIDLDIYSPEIGTSPLAGADLYAAAAFRSARHLRLSEAQYARIPALVAIQFPDSDWLSPSIICRQPAAFDPQIMAADLRSVVKPWL